MKYIIDAAICQTFFSLGMLEILQSIKTIQWCRGCLTSPGWWLDKGFT